MIAKLNRFHTQSALKHVYRHGKSVRSPMLSLKFVPNNRHQAFRVAVVVSKKVSKSAVTRNRIRRRIYEIIRHQTHSLKLGYDLVFTVFSDQITEIPHEQLQKTIIVCLNEADLLNQSPNTGT